MSSGRDQDRLANPSLQTANSQSSHTSHQLLYGLVFALRNQVTNVHSELQLRTRKNSDSDKRQCERLVLIALLFSSKPILSFKEHSFPSASTCAIYAALRLQRPSLSPLTPSEH